MSDEEVLAEFLREVEAQPQIDADANAIETRNWTYEARAILASDWLAERDAQVRSQERERFKNAVEAVIRLISPDHVTPMGSRMVRAVLQDPDHA